ncbi:hypothetical protein HZH66_012878 [Vespula vulgaris]|uniref:TGF-beta family profile domain-containing protein n=1 Tax=Vespula vulgaris TaxID=7454 RepID=A0A834J899_VESVU|nr:hypothetical protein HZH66_012878 [Vespula vulgaris]
MTQRYRISEKSNGAEVIVVHDSNTIRVAIRNERGSAWTQFSEHFGNRTRRETMEAKSESEGEEEEEVAAEEEEIEEVKEKEEYDEEIEKKQDEEKEEEEEEEEEDDEVEKEGQKEKEKDGEILQRLFFPVEIPEDLNEEYSTVDHASLRFLLTGDHRGSSNNDNYLEIVVYLRNEQLDTETITSSSSSSSSSSSASASSSLSTLSSSSSSSSSSGSTRKTTRSRKRSPQVRRKIRLDDPRDSKWLEFDVTDLTISSFLDEPKILEFEIEFLQNGKRNRRNIDLPVLNLFTTSRRKRGAPEQLLSLHKGRRTECRGDNKKCCRHEMTVIFKDLKGFEFIVQPKTFDAGYCKGRCPPRYNPAHHHALLQSLIWKEDRRKAPRPCCAPSKLAELEILYFDENDSTSLKVSNWKNMRVLECACS